MKRPSIREVAKLAKVSTATISNVFSGKKPVSKELQDRVKKAAQSLGYQVNRTASQLRSQQNKVITVLVPSIIDSFFATIVTVLESCAYKQGYNVIIASAHNQRDIEELRIKVLLSWYPAGMIVIPCSAHISPLLREQANNLPIVLVDRVASDILDFDTIIINNRESGEIGCRYLIDAGHRRILIIATDLSYPPINERVQGGKSAMAAVSAIPEIIEIGAEEREGALKIGTWLDNNPLPSAIFALTNVVTLSTLTALAERNIRVAADVSLLTFDDCAWMSARSVSLSSIAQPVEEIAKHAWSRLMLRLTSKNTVYPNSTIILNTSLIKRASVEKILLKEKV